METAILLINRFFDFLWTPLSRTPPYLDFLIISAASALGFLFIFKKTSNQEKIKEQKNRIIAYILQIRLYRDQPIHTLQSIKKILWHNVIYLKFAMIPLLIIVLPLLIISMQLHYRYGFSPVRPGDRLIIRAKLDEKIIHDTLESLQMVKLYPSYGIVIETPPMRVGSNGNVLWRARITNPGEKELSFRVAIDGKGSPVERAVVNAENKKRFSPQKGKWCLKGVLFHSAEGFIPRESPFQLIHVQYKRSTYPFLFWDTDPVILYFLFTLGFAFIFKPFMKVNI